MGPYFELGFLTAFSFQNVALLEIANVIFGGLIFCSEYAAVSYLRVVSQRNKLIPVL
jgi:hypothetical protein